MQHLQRPHSQAQASCQLHPGRVAPFPGSCHPVDSAGGAGLWGLQPGSPPLCSHAPPPISVAPPPRSHTPLAPTACCFLLQDAGWDCRRGPGSGQMPRPASTGLSTRGTKKLLRIFRPEQIPRRRLLFFSQEEIPVVKLYFQLSGRRHFNLRGRYGVLVSLPPRPFSTRGYDAVTPSS